MINFPDRKTNNQKEKIPFYIKNFKSSIILLILVIIILGFFFLVKPQYNKYKTSKILLDHNNKNLENTVQNLVELDKIIKDYRSINFTDEERINDMLPDMADESSLYVNIESIAKKFNFSLDDITIQKFKNNSKKKKNISAQTETKKSDRQVRLQKVQVKFTLSNVNYIKLKSLFKSLEKNLRLFDVQSFSFNSKKGTLDVELITYFIE